MNIHEKLIEVRKSVDSITKDAENPAFKFQYASSTAVIHALRGKMNEMKLLLIPSIRHREISNPMHVIIPDKHHIQSKQIFTALDITFTWVDAENPESKIECNWHGQGIDSGEKGVGKALTYAEKYFLLKFFNIPTDKDDPDSKGNGQDKTGKDKKKTGKDREITGKDTIDPETLKGEITDDQAKVIIIQIIGSHLMSNFEKYRISNMLYAGMTKAEASKIIFWFVDEKKGERAKRTQVEKDIKDKKMEDCKSYDDWLHDVIEEQKKKHAEDFKLYSTYLGLSDETRPFNFMDTKGMFKHWKSHMDEIKDLAKETGGKK